MGGEQHGSGGCARLEACCALLLMGCSVFDATLLDPTRGGTGGAPAAPVDAGADAMLGPPSRPDASGDGDGDAHADAMTSFDASDDARVDGGGALDGSTGDASGDQDAMIDPDASVCELASVTDYCAALPALAAAPVIDGALDCGPQLLVMPENGWNGASALPGAHEARFAFATRPDGLYVYVEVRGQAPVPHPATDAVYCGDAIELYLDADGAFETAGAYDDPGTMQFIVAAPASAEAPDMHAARYRGGTTLGAWTSTNYQLAWFADGYAFEALIVAADLGLTSWTPATAIGLDMVIDVSGPADSPDLRCGRLLGQYFLRVSAITPSSCSGEPWCDTRAFCLPALAF